MPKIEILPWNSDRKPYEIMTEWQKKPGAVPWVQVGNLYLSCFETGNTSWHPLVEQLANGTPKRTRFTVCTGRHGDYVVKTDTTSGQFTGVADAAHLAEDLEGVATVKKSVPPGVDIMVVDVTDPDFNSIPKLQSLLMQNISAGRTVVLAWCYSLFAMNAVPTNISQKDLQSKVPALKVVTLKQVVADHWAFAT
jgi:hypothetical protein